MAQLTIHIFMFLLDKKKKNDPVEFPGPCSGLGFSVALPEKQQFANEGEGGEKKKKIQV